MEFTMERDSSIVNQVIELWFLRMRLFHIKSSSENIWGLRPKKILWWIFRDPYGYQQKVHIPKLNSREDINLSISIFRPANNVKIFYVAIAAKNSKPGDRVYLHREKQWATVQWIGKIGNDTVVDLIYVSLEHRFYYT